MNNDIETMNLIITAIKEERERIFEALLSDEAIEGVFEVLDSGSAGNDPTTSKEDWLRQIREGITAAVAKIKEGE